MAQEITTLQRPNLSPELRDRLMKPARHQRGSKILSQTTQNPSLKFEETRTGNGKVTASRRYFAPVDEGNDWPPELSDYNKRFTDTLELIKRRHDGVVTTVGQFYTSV